MVGSEQISASITAASERARISATELEISTRVMGLDYPLLPRSAPKASMPQWSVTVVIVSTVLVAGQAPLPYELLGNLVSEIQCVDMVDSDRCGPDLSKRDYGLGRWCVTIRAEISATSRETV